MSPHIQEEIIKRLPIKSLIRSRSVCKAWKSLIDCSEFIAAYGVRHTQRQHLVVRYQVGGYPEEIETKYVSFVDDHTFPQKKIAVTVPPLVEILDDDDESRMIGSSHGLLCIYGNKPAHCPGTSKWSPTKDDIAVLWNPSIRRSIAVVVPNLLDSPFSSVFGFGVCPHTSDPKLVKVTYVGQRCHMNRIGFIPNWQVMVFSLSSKGWRFPCNNLPRKSIGFTWSQAAIGQFIYWLAYDRLDESRNHKLIMSFDMGTEEFIEVNLPHDLVYSSLSISRLRESLALVQFNDYISRAKQLYVVWMMEHGDPKSFTKLYTFKPSLVAGSIYATLGFRKSGELIVRMRPDNNRLRLARSKNNKIGENSSTLAVYEPFS